MDTVLEILKKIFIQHIEKALFALLGLTLAVTVLKSAFSLLHEVASQEPIVYPTYPKEGLLPQIGILPDEYNKLIQTIQLPLDLQKEKSRNLFARKTEEQMALETQELEKLDGDRDGMPNDWEIRYGLDPANPLDAQSDLDHDHYSNLDEYIGGSDPLDHNSFPGMIKLRVIKIYRKSIQVNFFGYIKLPSGSFQLQINWGRHTAFLKRGQKIHGYKILEFQQATEKKFNPQIGADEVLDTSFIKIQKAEDPPITLVVGKPSFEKELNASILDSATGRIYTVHTSSKIKSYKVLDIDASRVIIVRNKKTYTLNLERKR